MRERLTPEHGWQNASYDTWEVCGLDHVCKRDCWKPTPCKIPKMLYRLAAYEDTGLTPKQIEAYAENIEADKDEQAGRIMRMEDGLEKAKQIFRNIEIITSCPETGNEKNAMQMAIDGHRLMVALLGGKEDDQSQKT